LAATLRKKEDNEKVKAGEKNHNKNN